jgi:hypothetical protein
MERNEIFTKPQSGGVSRKETFDAKVGLYEAGIKTERRIRGSSD